MIRHGLPRRRNIIFGVTQIAPDLPLSGDAWSGKIDFERSINSYLDPYSGTTTSDNTY